MVPRTVADANRAFVRNRPVALPHNWRIVFVGGDPAAVPLVVRFAQPPNAPPVSRSTTIGFLLSVPRARTKRAGTPAPYAWTLPVSVFTDTVPLVTSTVAPYGIVPPVNALPLTSTVPVVVAVGGADPAGGAASSENDAAECASGSPPALVKFPPAISWPAKTASAFVVAFNG